MDGRERAAAAMLGEISCLGTWPVAVMDGRERAATAKLLVENSCMGTRPVRAGESSGGDAAC
jgi:hypothetical protein